MIPYHVTHGMNGAVMVLPREGLTDAEGNALTYDSIAYIGEQDYYLPMDENGDYKNYEFAGDDYSDSLDAMRTLTPTHSVFNGAVGALTGDASLRAKVGDTSRVEHSPALQGQGGPAGYPSVNVSLCRRNQNGGGYGKAESHIGYARLLRRLGVHEGG